MLSLLVPALVGVLIMGPYMYICVTGHQFVNYLGSAFLKAAPILWMSGSGYALYSSLPSKIQGENVQTVRTYAKNIAIGLLFSSFGDVSLVSWEELSYCIFTNHIKTFITRGYRNWLEKVKRCSWVESLHS